MIALTWFLDLPLATDASLVRAHAARLGAALDDTDGLLAGVVGVAEAGVDGETRNRLALISLWGNSSRMAQFLWSDAVAGIERELARPSARLWSVTTARLDGKRIASPTHAGVSVTPAANHPLADRVAEHRGAADRAIAGRSTALSARGFDTASWEEVSVDVWTGRPRTYDGIVVPVASVHSSRAQ